MHDEILKKIEKGKAIKISEGSSKELKIQIHLIIIKMNCKEENRKLKKKVQTFLKRRRCSKRENHDTPGRKHYLSLCVVLMEKKIINLIYRYFYYYCFDKDYLILDFENKMNRF